MTKEDILTSKDVPALMPVAGEAIPAELRELKQWVCWRWTWVGGRWSKVPVQPGGRNAKVNDPATWGTFADCLAATENYSGLGFVFGEHDPYCGIDLDACRDPATGEITQWAAEIVKALDTYCEVSPSGTGLKLWARATVGQGRKKGDIEIYDRAKYFCMTGQHLDGTPTTIGVRQDQVDALLAKLGAKDQNKRHPNGHTNGHANGHANGHGGEHDLTDDQIIKRACLAGNGKGERFARLWAGDSSEYESASHADMALVNDIAFWCGPDVDRIDGLFRKGGLFREKWEREDYGKRTINKVLANKKDFYNPKHKGRHNQNGEALPNEDVTDPHRLGRLYLKQRCQYGDKLTLRHWQDEWHRWDSGVYKTLPEKELRADVTQSVKEEMDRVNLLAQELAIEKGEEELPTVRHVTGRMVSDVVHALMSMAVLSSEMKAPAWIEDGPFSADEILACKNGLVHLPSYVDKRDYFIKSTPLFFTKNRIDIDFDPNATAHPMWSKFLCDVWEDDQDSINTLQEIMGYMLTPDTKQQKVFMFVGPKRSGKGTIGRVLRALVGTRNLCAPTLSSLGGEFGLQPLLHKTVALIADCRLSGKSDVAQIVERLLSLSGEDPNSVNRKFLPQLETMLAARFLLLTNEIPKLIDPSGALASRFVVLAFSNSFLGREDVFLTKKLLDRCRAVRDIAADTQAHLVNAVPVLVLRSCDVHWPTQDDGAHIRFPCATSKKSGEACPRARVQRAARQDK